MGSIIQIFGFSRTRGGPPYKIMAKWLEWVGFCHLILLFWEAENIVFSPLFVDIIDTMSYNNTKVREVVRPLAVGFSNLF